MNILIYSPYIDTLGGGESYLFNFANCFLTQHQVFLVWPDKKSVHQAARRFNLDLDKLIIIPFLPPRSHLRQFDLVFFVSDGSLPFQPFTNTVVHFQVPFHHVGDRSLVNRFKLASINHIVCNSNFTKKYIDQEFGVNSQVIYPAVNTPSSLISKTSKSNLILSVGRFTQSLHHKNQSALIDAFIKLEHQLPDWQLVLVGGTEPGSSQIINRLKRQAYGHRIAVKTDISHQALINFYSQAKLYWHATGFGEDLVDYPERAEHFGISIVEAMAHQAVPLVFNAGGPKEIITPQSGFTWDSIPELQSQTLQLAHHQTLRQKIAKAAQARSQFFNPDKFCQAFHHLIHA